MKKANQKLEEKKIASSGHDEIERKSNSSQDLLNDNKLEFLLKKGDESEIYTHTILDNMGDAIFIKDDQSRLLLVNNSFCELFGLTREEIIGKTLTEHVTQEERESFLKIDREVVANGVEIINEETLTLRGGNQQIISTRKSRFIDAANNAYIIGAIRDITASKRAELALQESEKQLRELNATKDKLFAIIGHDLRSPFNNILTLTELLRDNENKANSESVAIYLDMIASTSTSTLKLLESLLEWSHSQTGQTNFKSEKINVIALILEVQELAQNIAFAKNVSIQEPNVQPLEIVSDAKLLKTILRNLLSNAIKFTKSGGAIAISVKEKKNTVEFVVSDTGVGMSNQLSEKLFNIATNSSLPGTANEKGSGFGLVICKEFVEKLGGKIWVESQLGKGSDFKFTLPLER